MKNRGMVIIFLFFVVSAVLLWLAPAEQTLGQWVKLIYFHFTLSYAGLYAFYASGILGAAFILSQKPVIGMWSFELGLSALVVWLFSVALSLISMQVVWGGLFWREPLTIAAFTMIVLGLGKEIVARGGSLKIRSAANIALAVAILLIRNNMGKVMHPESPIRSSDSAAIRWLPMLLLIVTLVAIFEFTRFRVSLNKSGRISRIT